MKAIQSPNYIYHTLLSVGLRARREGAGIQRSRNGILFVQVTALARSRARCHFRDECMSRSYDFEEDEGSHLPGAITEVFTADLTP